MKLYAIVIITFFLLWSSPGYANNFKAYRVAHAGGGINGKRYTNSYEALDNNIKNGFLYFEIDFSFTDDNQLVCLHDWGKSFRQKFRLSPKERLTLDEFKFVVREFSEYENCTLDGLAAWMKENPSAVIITDVKDDNIKALALIHKAIPHASVRVIPQVYYPENFRKIKEIGYDSIIWTLYRYRASVEDVLFFVDSFYGSFAITMPKSAAVTVLPKELARKGISSYVHTVNNENEMLAYFNEFGITEIYTDFLIPQN